MKPRPVKYTLSDTVHQANSEELHRRHLVAGGEYFLCGPQLTWTTEAHNDSGRQQYIYQPTGQENTFSKAKQVPVYR